MTDDQEHEKKAIPAGSAAESSDAPEADNCLYRRGAIEEGWIHDTGQRTSYRVSNDNESTTIEVDKSGTSASITIPNVLSSATTVRASIAPRGGLRADIEIPADRLLFFLASNVLYSREDTGIADRPAPPKSPIIPNGDRVAVLPAEAAEVTKGGILLPAVAQNKPQEGIVVAVGTGRVLESGAIVPVPFAPGDRVLYSKYGGSEIKVDGSDVLVIRTDDIHGKVA